MDVRTDHPQSSQALTESGVSYEYDVTDVERVVARVTVLGSAHPRIARASLVSLEFFDARRNRIGDDLGFTVSPVVGPYKYLSAQPGKPRTTSIEFVPPQDARTFRLTVRLWLKDAVVALVGHPNVLLIAPHSALSPKREALGVAAAWSQESPPPAQGGTEVTGRYTSGSDLIEKTPKVFELPVPDTPRGVSISVHTYLSGEFAGSERLNSAALASVHYLDQNGENLMPDTALAMNKDLGPYHYLIVEPGGVAETQIPLTLPARCRTIRVGIRAWNGSVQATLVGEPRIQVPHKLPSSTNVSDQIRLLLNRASSRKGLILLYTTAPTMGHASLGLRPNRLAREYAKLGWAVAFFPFGSVDPDESEYSECIFQFTRSNVSSVMEEAQRQGSIETIFICSSFPDTTAVAAVDLARTLGWTTLYEVRDEMEEFNRVGYSTWYRSRLEAYVCRNASFVTTVSPALLEKVIAFGANPRTSVVIPNAVDDALVSAAKDLRRGRVTRTRFRPKVGYIGHLTPSWFDWQLVIAAAEQLPDIEFEIIGHGAPEDIVVPANMTLLGGKTHSEFLEICYDWKVGLIPFKASRLTRAVDPNKLFEYLAAGLSVVSAEMGSVDSSPLTHVYRRPADFLPQLTKALAEEFTATSVESIEHYLGQATWIKRASDTLEWIQAGRR